MSESFNKFGNVHSVKLQAGSRRTYFFDIKQNKSGDYYLIIAENTKKPHSDYVEKHKIFIFKEDVHKFAWAMNKSLDQLKELTGQEVDHDINSDDPPGGVYVKSNGEDESIDW